MSDLERLTLVEALRNNVVHLEFFKKDGSLREAFGTLCMEVVARNGAVPRGQRHRTCNNIITYYDLQKREWRSFDTSRLVSYDLPQE